MLPQAAVTQLLMQLNANVGARVLVDLPQQIVRGPDGAAHPFEIDAFAKHCLIEGLDEISYTLTLLPAIEAYESRMKEAQ